MDKLGKKFGRLTVIGPPRRVNNKTLWLCLCSCGNKKEVSTSNLGVTKSCGCFRVEHTKSMFSTHGQTKTQLWRAWFSMRQRCENRNKKDWERYGGRGIKVCRRWGRFEKFSEDMGASFLSHCKEFGSRNTSIGRVNNDKGYSPGNCRWETVKVQARNRTSSRILTFNGNKMTLVEWAERLGIRSGTLARRIDVSRWSVKRALLTPVRLRKI